MAIKRAITALTIGILGMGLGTGAALSQEQEETRLDVGIEAIGDIRSVEARENTYKQELDQAIEQVGFTFNAAPGVILQSQALSDGLHQIGVGENSQVAATLCAIGELEVPSRYETFRQAYFHLNTVEELLAESTGQPAAAAIDAELMDSFTTEPVATYLYIHASLVENNCNPPLVVASLFE